MEFLKTIMFALAVTAMGFISSSAKTLMAKADSSSTHYAEADAGGGNTGNSGSGGSCS